MHRDHPTTGPPTATARPLPAAHELCPCCQGTRTIYEPSLLGLMPVVCDGCMGSGRRAATPAV